MDESERMFILKREKSSRELFRRVPVSKIDITDSATSAATSRASDKKKPRYQTCRQTEKSAAHVRETRNSLSRSKREK